MRSFLGKDILSLKDFERPEFFRIFEAAAELEPIAREPPQYGSAGCKNTGHRFLPAIHAHPPCS